MSDGHPSLDHKRRSVAAKLPRGQLGRLIGILGPGLVTGGADDDPAGIVTDTQAGAQFRYGLAWTALIQLPLLAAVQVMVARVGLVTGKDFTRVLGEHYPRAFLWLACALLAVANTVTAGADLAGVAAAAELITKIPRVWIAVALSLALPAALLTRSYGTIARAMKWLTMAMFGYVMAALLARPAWGEVLRGTFIPAVQPSRDYLTMLIAVFGGTISPYMLVWQSAQEGEELRAAYKRPLNRRPRAAGQELRRMYQDTILGMSISQLIEYCAFVAAGTVIFPTGLREITSARQAAVALHPVGSGAGEALFAIAMIGTGLIAVPTLTGSTAYAFAAAAKRPSGIFKTPSKARGFYVLFVAGTVIAGMIAIVVPHPMQLLVASQVVNGLLAPPLIILVLLVANNRAILGPHTNGRLLNTLGVVTLLIMGGASIWLAGTWVAEMRH